MAILMRNQWDSMRAVVLLLMSSISGCAVDVVGDGGGDGADETGGDAGVYDPPPDDAFAEGRDGGRSNAEAGSSSDAPGGADIGAAVDAHSGADAATSIDASTPVGACDSTCTGTKMCNAASVCVCAPGWIPAGKDCVAAPISAPASRTKAEVCARYKAATAAPAVLWKPGTGGECDPGTVPYDAQVAALQYLDFYRWMVGVGPVQVSPELAPGEQQCAKILDYTFGHAPVPTDKCYTPDGAKACGASLIASGYDLISQFDGYGLETDQELIHRRNILAVGRAGVWAGASGGSADMHYGGAYPTGPGYAPLASDPAFVAHPGPGFNVAGLVPSRWFVRAGTATVVPLDAHVFVKATGEEKPMKRSYHTAHFSAFDPDGWTPALDTTYRVELVDDAKKEFASYETTLIVCP